MFIADVMGYRCQRADESFATLPQGNQEPLVLRNKLRRPIGELALWNVILCPFSALTLLVGRREGHRASKRLGVGLLVVTI